MIQPPTQTALKGLSTGVMPSVKGAKSSLMKYQQMGKFFLWK